MSAAKAAALARLFTLAPDDRVLDIGCGRAQFLLELLATHPAHGVGVDANPAFIARARAAAVAQGLADRVTLLAQPLSEAVTDDGTYAAVICMGSSQAIGSFADALAWALRALKPGGTALFADGYWKAPPAAPYLAVLGATADEMRTHADNAAAGARCRLSRSRHDDEQRRRMGRVRRALLRGDRALRRRASGRSRCRRDGASEFAGGTTRTCAGDATRWASVSISC